MIGNSRWRWWRSSLLAATTSLLLAQTGCSVKQMAMNMISDALSGEGGTVFTGDDDPELIGDALPFALKMYESLLESNPNHAPLLLATGKAFTLYAYAYVQFPADTLPDEAGQEQARARKRAKKLFLRGRDYILRALDVRNPGFSQAILSGSVDSALVKVTPRDTSYLYWAGMAWMGGITANKFDLGMMMAMPRAMGLIHKAFQFNPTFGRGSLHEFYVSYFASMPASMGGSEEKARAHFDQAIKLAGGLKAGPYVSLASSISVKKQDRAEFEHLLGSALAIDVNASKEDRLANLLAQQKARWMLDHVDRFFLSDSLETEN